MTDVEKLLASFEGAVLVDDTRNVVPGSVFVWDDRNKPGAAEALFAQAQAAGARAIVSNVPATAVTVVEQPGALLAAYAKAAWPRQPQTMLGITGTSGKTSVAWFVQQLADRVGRSAVSIGTLGIVRKNVVEDYLGFTSPTALKLHPILDRLAGEGVDTAVMEVSSHALELRRVEGVRFSAVGLTNMTQDHLDFHGSLEAYHAAKARFFTELLPDDGVAVLNMNRMESWPVASMVKQRGVRMLGVGTANAELVVAVNKADARGLELELKYDAVPVPVQIPLLGSFQAENLAIALGLLVAAGYEWKTLAAAVEGLTGVPGRMELVPGKNNQPVVVVDYAHKPDALQRALESLRPLVQVSGGKVWVVFGCGGNRDATKRPIMGKIAAEMADFVVVTDDNPRREVAENIRKEVVAGVVAGGGMRRYVDMGDRRAAIAHAVAKAGPEDIILVAGKGHEDGQIVGDTVLPFDDRVVVREILG